MATKNDPAHDLSEAVDSTGNIPTDAITKEDQVSADITPGELELLDNAGINKSSGDDDQLLSESQLDDSDEDDEGLNEEIDLTGEDLDVPGSESDDESEAIGEEDEENNSYSLSDQVDGDI